MPVPIPFMIATAAGKVATSQLMRQAVTMGTKKFIQTYGTGALTALGLTSLSQDTPKKEEPLKNITESLPTQSEDWSKSFKDADEGREEETTGTEVSTEVDEQPPKLPEEDPDPGYPYDPETELYKRTVEEVITRQTKENQKQTKKLLEDKKPDISKQTKELVPEKPEFGKLTETETQTAKALKEGKSDFYSRAIEAIKNAKQEKFTKGKWKSIIQSNSTKDEMEYLGLTEFLQGNESITKKELLNFVEGKDIAPNIAVRSVPEAEMNQMYGRYSLGFERSGTQEHIVFQIDTPERRDVYGTEILSSEKYFLSEHFNREYGTDTFAHARVQVGFGDSDSPPADYEHLDSKVFDKFNNTLIIDEIQSDWLQKGQDKGFITDYDIVPGDKLVDYFKKHNITYKYEKKPLEYGYPLEGYRRVEFTQADSIEPGDARAIGEMDPDITYIFRKSDNTEFARWEPDTYPDSDGNYDTVEEFLQKAWGKVPDFPIKESKKWVELVLNKMIEKAALDGRDSIAITNGQIQANRYEAMDQKKKEGLKKFYDEIVFKQLEKIANKYNVELDRIDIGDTEQAQMDQDDIQMSMPRYVKQAQDNDLYLQKITLQELWDRTKDTDIPGHTTLYSNLGRGQGHNYIEDYLYELVDNRPFSPATGTGSGLDKWNEIKNNEVYVWKAPTSNIDEEGMISWDMPIVPVADTLTNVAVRNLVNATTEDREYILRQFTRGGEANYPYGGDNINNTDLIKYTEYLRNYTLPEGVDLGYDKGVEQLIKMKLPKKLQKERLSKPIKLSKKINEQTQKALA